MFDKQYIIDEVVKIATRYAVEGHPVERIIWIPPETATENPMGRFAIQIAMNCSATNKPTWE